jgi:hypothetical protein
MKISDIPQSGKRGKTVSMEGRYGQVSRILAVPANPETPYQLTIRRNLRKVSAAWRGLTEAQRAAWVAAAQNARSHSRLGQSGPLTGSQLFNKINCTLALFGQTQVVTPPAPPVFPDLAPQNLVITNTGGVIALKLTCPTDPGTNTIVRASSPLSAGRQTCNSYRILGACPAPVAGAADITGLYTARYGVPPAGMKVFVRVNQFVDGWEDIAAKFSAIVPTGA